MMMLPAQVLEIAAERRRSSAVSSRSAVAENGIGSGRDAERLSMVSRCHLGAAITVSESPGNDAT